MKRITLLTYNMKTPNTSPDTTSTTTNPIKAGSMDPRSGTGNWRGLPACWLKLRVALQPPEAISPASNPTTASRVHCQKRNGCTSCLLVCCRASSIVSTAEMGKMHLGGNLSGARYSDSRSGANHFADGDHS